MIWKEVLDKTDTYLTGKGVPDARVASELLAARLLHTGRGLLAGEMAKEVPGKCVEAMRRGMARLVKGEPIQYVLGEWDFRTLTLKCDRRALIPRPETEELVTRVLNWLEKNGEAVSSPEQNGEAVSRPLQQEEMSTFSRSGQETASPWIVDVGTGTGAIILSLAKELHSNAVFLGTDVSEDAIALAKENAERCGLSDRVKFVVMDGLDEFDEPQCVDVIVSNPPYIESAVCETLDPRVKDFEPRLALDGGSSGLDFYDRYLSDAVNLLKPGGAVFFEIGENQGEAVKKLMFDCGFDDIKIEKDFAGHDRYASAILK